jgi:hypothetical protein
MHQTRNNCGRIVEIFCRRARRGRIVEELWKNCRKILWALERQRRGKFFWKNPPGAKSFYNSSTILPRCAAGRGPAKSFYNFSTIFPQFFHNSDPLAVYPSKETKFPRRFCRKIVEEFGACQIWRRIFLSAAD